MEHEDPKSGDILPKDGVDGEDGLSTRMCSRRAPAAAGEDVSTGSSTRKVFSEVPGVSAVLSLPL